MKYIYAVTVTYGERFKYLKRVVDSLLEQEIDKIVIISNGSEEKSLIRIKELVNKFKQIELIDLKKNTGSANGFYCGINFAIKSKADFIWLLDDDNCPKKGALDALKEKWIELSTDNDENNTALLSYRSDRKIFHDAINLGKPYLMLGSRNSFLGFNIFSFSKSKINEASTKQKGAVAVAPYGGLFFHKTLIDTIGLPNRNFFLYGDDYDFSYRITKGGGKIYLIVLSEIEDLEKSFHIKNNDKKRRSKYFNTNSKQRIFYSVRNGIKFEQNFVSNKIIYFINAFIYLILLFFMMLLNPSHIWKYSIVLKGVRASLKK